MRSLHGSASEKRGATPSVFGEFRKVSIKLRTNDTMLFTKAGSPIREKARIVSI